MRALYPTDGSAPARDSIRLLKPLILPIAESLEVLSVAPHSLLSGARPDPLFLSRVSRSSRRNALLESEELARHAATDLDPPEIQVKATARWGSPVQEILRASRRPPPDLVVIGAKGHSNLALMVLGSVSQGIVQHSSVPVLVVRRQAASASKILIGYDDLPEAKRSLDFLDHLHLSEDTVSYVMTPFPGSRRPGGRSKAALLEAQVQSDQLRSHAELALDSVAARFSDKGVPVNTEVLAGEAAPQLIESAKRTFASSAHESRRHRDTI